MAPEAKRNDAVAVELRQWAGKISDEGRPHIVEPTRALIAAFRSKLESMGYKIPEDKTEKKSEGFGGHLAFNVWGDSDDSQSSAQKREQSPQEEPMSIGLAGIKKPKEFDSAKDYHELSDWLLGSEHEIRFQMLVDGTLSDVAGIIASNNDALEREKMKSKAEKRITEAIRMYSDAVVTAKNDIERAKDVETVGLIKSELHNSVDLARDYLVKTITNV